MNRPPHLRRRRTAALSLLALALLASGSVRAAGARKPNFLFIYTDDQRWDAMSVVQREQGEKGRFPWMQTPNMDRIAAEGVRFRNAFVTSSLCAPSRAAFLTGRYNHLNGIANNHTPLPENSVTHATLLHAAGYTTGFFGKWHMDGQSGQRPGFDFSASFVGQGRYFDCPIEVNGVSTPSKGWVDDVTTDYAIDFIRRNRDKPFSIILGLKSTHGPTDPPERAKNRFAGAQARSVPNLNVRAIYREGEGAPAAKKAKADGSNINLNYFRCISGADDDIGRILAALDELGLTDDTIVIFTSDNGYYLGEHGLGDKRSAYDEALRIPLLVRWPRMFPKGTTRDEMVLNIDLAPTLLDFAGVTAPREMQGRSWRPLLLGQKVADWRQSFFAEYFYEHNFGSTPTVVAVRTATAKFIKYPGHEEWTELFDLEHDGFETKNLVKSPEHKELLKKMSAEFEQQMKAVDFRIPDYADKPGEAPPKKAGKAKKANRE